MRKKSQTYYLKDIWEWYSFKLLEANPTWCGVNKDKIKNFFIYAKYKNTQGKRVVDEVLSYKIFSECMKTFFNLAKHEVIQTGLPLHMIGLGYIQPRRVQRDHSKKVINYARTNQQPKVWSEERQKMVASRLIYYTTDDWCRIGWKKKMFTPWVPNLALYEFKVAQELKSGQGFGQMLSKAITENPHIVYKYEYYPLRKHTKPAAK